MTASSWRSTILLRPRAGLKTASRLAAAHDAEILVVHAHEIPVALTMGVPSDASSLVEQSHKDSQGLVARAVAEVTRLDLRPAEGWISASVSALA